MLFFLIFCVGPCSSLTSMTFVVGPSTPPLLYSQLSQAINSRLLRDYRVRLYNVSSDPLPEFDTPFLLDFTFSVSMTFQLKEIACRRNLVLLIPDFPSSSPLLSSFCVYYTHPPLSHHSQAMSTLIKKLGWNTLFVISSTSSLSRQMSNDVSSNLSKKKVSIEETGVFSNRNDIEEIEEFVARNIKPARRWNILILNEPTGSQKVIQSCKNKHMYKKGLGVVIGSLGALGEYDLGTIYVIEKGLEGASNQAEYEILSILKIVDTTKDRDVLNTLKERFPENVGTSEFSVINYKTDSVKEKVGEIQNNTFSRVSQTIFPGNVTEIPDGKHPLPFSMNTQPLNYDGSLDYGSFELYRGAKVVTGLVNDDPSFIPNYEFQIYEAGCGSSLFNHDHYKDCYSSQLDKLGYFLLESYSEEVVLGTIKVFREIGFNIPSIGVFLTYDGMEDKDLYPELVVPTPFLMYTASILPNILQALRWMNVIIFASDSSLYMYDIFMQRASDMGINILNSLKYHIIDETYTPGKFEMYKEYFQNALDTKGSIIILLASTSIQLYIAEGLYDIGFREGDIQLIFFLKLISITSWSDLYGFDLAKVSELSMGSLALYYEEWIGEYGESLEPIIAEAVAPKSTDHLCFPIDSFLLGAHALQMMIRIGKDFEDPLQLMDYIRQQRFTGCSGIVSIDSTSNGRSILSYGLFNFYNDTSANKLVEKKVGSYTIGVSVPLVISKDIVWPKGHSQPMPDIRQDPECGIPPESIRDLQKSRDLSRNIFILLLLSSCATVIVLSYRYWKFKCEILTEQSPITFEDGIYMLSALIEAVQVVTIAPCSSQFPDFVLYYFHMTILDIELDRGEYWWLLETVMFVSFVWSCCCTIVFLVKTERWPERITDFTYAVGVRLFPYISLICFLPFVRTLSSIYLCDKASGDKLIDAFFYRECNMSCWTGSHLVFVSFVSIVLVLYISIGTLSRLYWDEYSDCALIKTNPRYAIWKGLFYAILAGLSILPVDKADYLIAFWSLFAFHTIIGFCTDQTNYKRFNSWLRIGSIGVVWVVGVNCVAEGNSEELRIGLQLGGLGLLGGIGLFLQIKYFKSMLYREKTVRVYDLFRFGLAKKISRETINAIIRELKRGTPRAEIKYIENQ